MNLILRAIKSLFRKIELMRTHYDTRQTQTVTLTFDGNMEGKETVDGGDGQYLVKVSNEPIPVAEMIGAQATMCGGGENFSVAVSEDMLYNMSEQLYMLGDIYVVVALEDSEVDGLAFSKGVWVRCDTDANGVSTAYLSSLSRTHSTGELKKLDEKYLPDSVNDGIAKAQAAADMVQTAANDKWYGYDLVIRLSDQGFTFSEITNDTVSLIKGDFEHILSSMENKQGLRVYLYAGGSFGSKEYLAGNIFYNGDNDTIDVHVYAKTDGTTSRLYLNRDGSITLQSGEWFE